MPVTARPWDVLTVGRVGIDLYPQETGVPLERVAVFGRYLGGSGANVAVAAARLGERAAIVTGVGDDPFGRFARDELERLGVSARFVVVDRSNPTPVAFAEFFPPDRFPLWYYRRPAAPDLRITAADLDADAVRTARLLWVTGSGLSAEPSRSCHDEALRLRAGGGTTVLDLDYRPAFWASPSQAGDQLRRVLPSVDVAVGNVEECALATGETDPDRAAEALLGLGVRLAVIKRGPLGVLARTRDERVEVPPVAVDVVNGLGAGDAFGGSLAHGLLAGEDLPTTLRRANAAGAIVASRLECAAAMPTPAEIDLLLATPGTGARSSTRSE